MQEQQEWRRKREEESLKNSVLDSAAAARFSTAAALEAAKEKGIAGGALVLHLCAGPTWQAISPWPGSSPARCALEPHLPLELAASAAQLQLIRLWSRGLPTNWLQVLELVVAPDRVAKDKLLQHLAHINVVHLDLYCRQLSNTSLSALVGTIDWRTSTLAGDENQADKRETQMDKKEPAAEDSVSEQPSRPVVPEGLF